MEDGPLPLRAALESENISRPSSTSTQTSTPQNPPQDTLPGISSLANANGSPAAAAADSPQQRTTPVPIAPAMCPPGTSPASTHPGPGGNLPTCHNCATSTTPLWRRDEIGSVLCNACGLFLKLHGRPRPISLKTDVIKSRNRVKTMRPDLAKQKKQNQGLPATADMNGVDQNHMNNGGVTNFGTRRPSQKSNGHVDDTNSPISRTGTPNMYNSHIAPIYHTIDDQFQPQSMPGGFAVSAPSPGRAQSPLNGEHMPPTHEQLLALNASLKTRVSELEVIQELYRGRLQQLENEENMRQVQETENAAAQLRAQLEEMTESRNQLQKLLNDSHHRERILKGRLDEIEAEHSAAIGSHDNGRAKRLRVDDGVAAQPQSQSQSQPQSQQPEPQPEPQSQPQLLPAEPVLEVAELPSESPELPDAPEIIESISNPQPVSLS